MNTLALGLSLCAIAACASEPAQDGRDDDFTSGGKADEAIAEDSPEARAILVVVNTATVTQLTGSAPAGVVLSQETADSIVAFRAGADGMAGTDDDEKIDTLAELDTVPFIGPVALEALLTYTAPTAQRVTRVELRDPHLFTRVIFCSDITSQLNDRVAQALVSDTNPQDGKYDLSVLSVFRPFQQAAVATATDLSPADCTATSSTKCTPKDPSVAAVATNKTTGSCLGVLPNTTGNYDPAVITTNAPCFSTENQTVTLPVGGIDLTLTDAQVAGRYSSNGGLISGLIRGFLSEQAANETILPADLPVVGGKPLSAVLAGGAGNCSSSDDRDEAPDGTLGWYFYVNFNSSKAKL